MRNSHASGRKIHYSLEAEQLLFASLPACLAVDSFRAIPPYVCSSSPLHFTSRHLWSSHRCRDLLFFSGCFRLLLVAFHLHTIPAGYCSPSPRQFIVSTLLPSSSHCYRGSVILVCLLVPHASLVVLHKLHVSRENASRRVIHNVSAVLCIHVSLQMSAAQV